MHGYMAARKKAKNIRRIVPTILGLLRPGTGFRSGASVDSSKALPANEAEAVEKEAAGANQCSRRCRRESRRCAEERSYGLVAKHAPAAEAASTNFCTAGE